MENTLQKVKTEVFTVAGKNGIPMAADATYIKSEKAMPVIVYAHGINGFKDWGGMDLIAQEFARQGFIFVKFNFSHNGTTPAHPMEFYDLNAYENDNYLTRQQDLSCLISFIEEEYHDWPVDHDALHLLGHSRGGIDALLFASDERIASLVTWSAPATAQTPWSKWDSEKMDLWKNEGVVYLENKRTHQKLPIGFQLYEEFKSHKNNLLNTEKAAREMQKPWLIAHGEDDEAVFVKEAYQLKEWQPQAQVALIENTGHTFDRRHPWEASKLPEASQKVVAETIRFLNKIKS